jgi:polysaccharide deacetylase family protein (PEP-CTERM system associated)
MSVDVEEYFQVSAFDSVISRGEWASLPSRLAPAIDKILNLFDEHDTKATFFTLGCIVDKHPDIIRRIAVEGHEIASHGQEHTRVSKMDKDQFGNDVKDTKKKLEDVAGAPVVGYRAPSFSIGDHTEWAYDELRRAGYEYSSSIYPIRHDHYGQPDAPRFPYRHSSGIVEIPMSTLSLLSRNWPCAGGGYFRLLPLMFSRWAFKRINFEEGMPAVFYFHPWELDPDQPRLKGISSKARFRHYLNLEKFEGRLADMLSTFQWDRMDRIFLPSR